MSTSACMTDSLADDDSVSQPRPTPASGNTWTAFDQNNVPIIPGLALLLPDGSVMVQDQNTLSGFWKLTPDQTGSYLNGTWTQLASTPSPYAPLYCASAVLPDGRVILEGGEYNGITDTKGSWTTLGAIYDPVQDAWTSVNPPSGWQTIGDAQSVVLADGRFMLANCCSTQEAILDPTNLTWSDIGSGKADINDEEGWTLLPNGDLITVDAENSVNPMNSELFDPSTGTWSSAGNTPAMLADKKSAEIGPNVLMPNGTVLATGGTGHNAVFTLDTHKWTAAPDFPAATNGEGVLDVADGPATLLPNGHVLVGTAPGVYNSGLEYFEWDGSAFNPAANPAQAALEPSYTTFLLQLPTGEILMDGLGITADQQNEFSDTEIYTPTPAAASDTVQWQPLVTRVPTLVGTAAGSGSGAAVVTPERRAQDSLARSQQELAAMTGASPDVLPLMTMFVGRTYEIEGARLNGLSQGAMYGDDAQMATNYPLVRFTNMTTGHVRYGKTHSNSNFSIDPSNVSTTQVDIPAGIETGLAKLEVVTNGIASPALLVNLK